MHGAEAGGYAYGMWPVVAFNILLFLFFAISFLIQWPSLTTLVMWPVLLFAYYRLSMREEKVMVNQFGDRYLEYRKKVPAFVPGFRGSAVTCLIALKSGVSLDELRDALWVPRLAFVHVKDGLVELNFVKAEA